jgi:hypothetical protein
LYIRVGLNSGDRSLPHESDEEDDAAEALDGENPIDKIYARREIKLLNPENGRQMIGRSEYFCKYKDLSYHQCDWVDRSTIERWKNGKARLTKWKKDEVRR